jgi:flagellar biosynthetic protein FlhB
VIASVVQNPPALVAKRVMPQMSRLSPTKGLKRIFSLSGLFEFLKLSLRLVVVVVTSIAILMIMWHDFTNSIWNDPTAILALSQKSVVALLTALALLSFTLLIFDLPVAHVLWRRSLRMARQEIKDEHKQMEGDPHMKARRRSIARERSRKRMLKGASRATVVIANPTHFAVALRYVRSEGAAPQVVAKGQDIIALKIRKIAEENGIPVIEDKALARSLYAKVEVDQMIPVEFYRAIAEILIRLQARRNRRSQVRA